MDKLQIKRETLHKLCGFCSLDLINRVFDSFGRNNINIALIICITYYNIS